MQARAVLLALLAGLVTLPAPGAAQVLTRPARAADETPAASTDPSARPTQQVFVILDALGGYDDNASVGGVDLGESPGPPTFTQPGYVGQLVGGLDYRRARGLRSFGLNGQGSFTTYRNLGVRPSRNASLSLSAATPVGRNNSLRLAQSLAYDSLYRLDAFSPIDAVAVPDELPTSTSLQGLLRRESWSSETSATLDRRWSRTNSTTAAYTLDRRQFTGQGGEVTFAHRGLLSYDRLLGRSNGVMVRYEYVTGEFASDLQQGGRRPYASHVIEGGPRFTKRVSPRRTLHLSAGVGGTYVDSVTGVERVAYAYWAPYGHADARIDVGRTWVLSGNYRRGVTAFEGITIETFLSDVVGVALGGGVGDRVDLVLSGGFATGKVGGEATAASDYDTYSSAAQVRVLLTSTLSAVLQYSYYKYAFGETSVLTPGVPSEFSRNAVRAGLSLRLPLHRRAGRPTQ